MKRLNLDNIFLNVKCSPIRRVGDIKTFIVNYDYYDQKVSKQCGIQLPQFHVAYNDGFTEGELNELIELTAENLDELIDEAMDKSADLDDDDPPQDTLRHA